MKKAFNHHEPVLLRDILNFTDELNGEKLNYLDVTFGRGGHALALDKKLNFNKIIAMDHDEQAVEFGKKIFLNEYPDKQILFLKSNFSDIETCSKEMDQFLKEDKISLILADLGVSSPQLDDPERGFSFYNNGPLDMRMDKDITLTAADILNTWTEEELVQLFLEKGEIRHPQKVVNAILEFREKTKFTTTSQISELVVSKFGWRKKGVHPATQVFLALRLEVNKELEVVEKSIESLIKLLQPGGLLMIITFHSLEDRIVKYRFKDLCETYGELVNKKVIQATWDEKKKNKRARSAKLRVFRRT